MSDRAQRLPTVLWYPNLAAEIARQDVQHVTLAADVRCNPQTISHILRGRVRPSQDLRQRLADRLGVDVDLLFVENPQIRHLTESRTEQGLSPTITDPRILRRIVTLAGGGHDAA